MAPTSTVDFPGRLAAVLFTPGCNYRCWYCHNSRLIDGDARCLDPRCVRDFLSARAGLLPGIVISGGEPTLQPGLPAFCRRLKQLGYAVKLDTNGSRPQVLATLLSQHLVDYVAVDHKAPLADYPRICGHDAAGLTETVELLCRHMRTPAARRGGFNWELRTTVLPEFTEATLARMRAEFPQVPRRRRNPYRDATPTLIVDAPAKPA
jgi:pyruvate formate lyase activating enzyme